MSATASPETSDRIAEQLASLSCQLNTYSEQIDMIGRDPNLCCLAGCELVMNIEDATQRIAGAIARAEDSIEVRKKSDRRAGDPTAVRG
jgi:hypothetical protein